jgi:hypothetical protein
MESEHQVPIWFFVGVLLTIYGVLITCAGIYAVIAPPPESERVALWGLHADIWWGLLLLLFGGYYCARFHPFGRSAESPQPPPPSDPPDAEP